MVATTFDPEFKKKFEKIKSKDIKDQIIKHVAKIKENPDVGKPMRYGRKGTRELYIGSFRLSYLLNGDAVYVLDLYHKDEQ